MIDIIFNTIARNKILSKDLWSTRIFLNAPDNRRIWCQKILWSLHGGLWWWICNDMPKVNLIRLMSFSLEILKKREGSILDIVSITLPAVRHKIFKQIKKKINKDACEKTKHFFVFYISFHSWHYTCFHMGITKILLQNLILLPPSRIWNIL